MMYREEWMAEIMGSRSVLDLALDVHMTNTGAMERSSADQDADVRVLREVLATWKATVHRKWAPFDNRVKELIATAIAEHEQERAGTAHFEQEEQTFAMLTDLGARRPMAPAGDTVLALGKCLNGSYPVMWYKCRDGRESWTIFGVQCAPLTRDQCKRILARCRN